MTQMTDAERREYDLKELPQLEELIIKARDDAITACSDLSILPEALRIPIKCAILKKTQIIKRKQYT